MYHVLDVKPSKQEVKRINVVPLAKGNSCTEVYLPTFDEDDYMFPKGIPKSENNYFEKHSLVHVSERVNMAKFAKLRDNVIS